MRHAVIIAGKGDIKKKMLQEWEEKNAPPKGGG